MLPQITDQFQRSGTVQSPFHGFQNATADVLQRNIQIAANFWIFFQKCDQIGRKTCRIGIMQTDPFDARDFRYSFRQLSNTSFSIEVESVIGQILGYEQNFFHSFSSQVFRFGENFFERFGDVFPSNQWDGTESAFPVAAFRNFQISVMRWCCQQTFANQLFFEIHFQRFQDLRQVIHTKKSIHLSHLLFQFLFVPLRETPRHHDLFQVSCFLGFNCR